MRVTYSCGWYLHFKDNFVFLADSVSLFGPGLPQKLLVQIDAGPQFDASSANITKRAGGDREGTGA